MTDPLTTAYIAIGAARELDKQRNERNFNLDQWSGELGFISDIIKHSNALDQAGYAMGDQLSHCVWCYDIAESFGERIARMMLDHEQIDFNAEIGIIIAENLMQ